MVVNAHWPMSGSGQNQSLAAAFDPGLRWLIRSIPHGLKGVCHLPSPLWPRKHEAIEVARARASLLQLLLRRQAPLAPELAHPAQPGPGRTRT